MESPSLTAKQVFERAVEIELPAAREAYVAQACAGLPDLQIAVAALLRAHEKSGTFLETPATDFSTTEYHPIHEGPGTVIGPYKLLQQLGEGGMGTVFMAEQTQPVQRRVALKIIKLGMDTRQVIARFEAERQALALMDHPNIARVLDAGTTETGRPYFVMELVKGVPITQYCDERHLTPEQRLMLFVDVCHAVQHAHQKGIIHRDLKPSNVMVAEYDEKPVPKVIDFGVAKAVGQQLTEKTMFTALGQVIGTIEYMSPEHAKLNQLDIDTRSDVYSLGVILYELLTGGTPFDRKRLQSAALDEMLRIIREEEPACPSTRLSGSRLLPSIAANRHLEPKKLTTLVRGELDWIVMKALEKDRQRRYETVAGLARDIERYINDEPVEACPPSAWYRFHKFARKHKVGLATASALAAALLLGGIGLAINNRMMAREKARTEANYRIALDAVDRFFTQVSESQPLKAHGLEGLRRDLLMTAKEFYEKFIQERSADPQLRAELARARMRLGFVTDILGSKTESIAIYQQALPSLEALASEQPENPDFQHDVAEVQNKLAQLFEAIGDEQKAEAAYVKARDMAQRLVDKHPTVGKYRRSLASGHSNLASLYKESGRTAQAEAAYTQSQRLMEGMLKEQPDDPNLLILLSYSYYNWGVHYRETNRLKEAETSLLDARRIQQKLISEHPDVPETRLDLANTHHELGIGYWIGKQFKEAEAALRQSKFILESLSQQHPLVPEYQFALAAVEGDLGNLNASIGNPKETEDAYARSGAILARLTQEYPSVLQYQTHLATSYGNRGIVYSRSDRPAEAEDSYQKARAILEGLTRQRPDLLEFAQQLGNSECLLGNLRLTNGKPQESLEWYGKAIPRLEDVLRQESRHQLARQGLRNAYWGRSQALSELGRHKDALPDRDRAVELNDQAEPTFRLGRVGTLVRLEQRDRANTETDELTTNGDAATVYNLACVYALASKDAGQTSQAEERAGRAVGLLRQAFEKDSKTVANDVTKDTDLDSLRSREDFQKLLKEWDGKLRPTTEGKAQ